MREVVHLAEKLEAKRYFVSKFHIFDASKLQLTEATKYHERQLKLEYQIQILKVKR